MKTAKSNENGNQNVHNEGVKKTGKSSHVEDWETDSNSPNTHDVKSEFEIRSHTKGGETGEKFLYDGLHWDHSESGPDDSGSGNDDRESIEGRDETIGIP
ncbi:MAG: hypothetical protein K0Q95_2183 [Bacteroidota bacterium]|jgi:hypothetical protein|nr:hypothetical protein [Bacteroidota bacterium]